MKMTLTILRLSFIVTLALIFSCNDKIADDSPSIGLGNLTDNYLESVAAVKAALGRDYLDSAFTLLDSIAPIRECFIDSLCLTMLLKDTVFISRDIHTSLESQQHKPSVWTEVPGFRFNVFKTETLKSIMADTSSDVAKIEKRLGRGFWTISYPLFLKQGQYCLVGLDFTCGQICGNTRVLLCKREKDKWIVVKTYCEGVA